MATPVWQPSTFYATGSLVQPATAQPAVPTPIPNPSFESGNVEWTLDAGLSIVNGIEHFGPGTWSLQANTGFAGDRFAEMQDFIDCIPGENITARCQIQQGASSFGNTGGAVGLRFYDSLNGLIQDFRGNEVIDGSGGAWHQSSVTASAPANTAFVRIYIYMKRVNQNLPFWADAVEWNKISQAQSGLIFKAVQPTVGLSGSVEPVWPIVNGAQVVDNEVIWEAILATRITWEAHAILVSGAVEPTFPAQEGGTVGDNTIAWRAVSRRVTDPNCPNSKIVIIGASKIFAADDDIVAYSATVNPLDWSTANDAGYIPSNLQQYGANPVAALGLYRSNLVVMNTQGSQVWQIDEDPAQMALLDAFPVGTAYHDALSPAFNDLFFVSSFGVRTLGIAGGSTNLQSGDAGMPIDPLVQEAISYAQANGQDLNSLYYPGAGQYWLMFRDFPVGPLTLGGDLPNANTGDAGTYQYAAAGGLQPYVFSISAGALPPGATMDENGLVTFDYTTPGSYSWTVRVEDDLGDVVFLNDSNVVAVYGPWFYGPVNRDGVAGGPMNYYKKTTNPKVWSAAPIVLPNGMADLGRISTANGALFFHGATAPTLARVSFDGGLTFTNANVQLNPNADVYWNGTNYYCGNQQSADGITWATITNNPGTAVGGTAFARASDGAIIIATGAGVVHVSLNNGATWTPKALPFSAPISASVESNGARISASMPAGIGFAFTDDLFTSVTGVPGAGFNQYTDARNGTFIGRAGTSYRRSTTLQAGSFTDVLLLQGTVGNTQRMVAHNDEQWACLKLVSSGQFRVNVADDDGITWAEGADILYGNGANIAFPKGSE